MSIEIYSEVRLPEPFGGYPAGTTGTVVEILNDEDVLVELFDASERSLGVEDIPVRSLEVTGEPAWRRDERVPTHMAIAA